MGLTINNNTKTAKHKGFTLVEVLVVVGTFALVIGGSTSLLMMILRNNIKTEMILATRQEGGNAVAVINREVTSGISCSANRINRLDGEVTIVCDNDTDTITLQTPSNTTPIPLVNNNPKESLKFDVQGCSISCNNSKGISVSFTLENTVGNISEKFSTYVSLRNAPK